MACVSVLCSEERLGVVCSVVTRSADSDIVEEAGSRESDDSEGISKEDTREPKMSARAPIRRIDMVSRLINTRKTRRAICFTRIIYC